MTAEGSGGLKERLFGSTSMHLMRKCPCPVWIIRSNEQKRYARILAAVDLEHLNKKRNSLNTLIIDSANSIAVLEKAELHIVHAWTLFSETFLTVRGRLPNDELNKLIMQEEAMHKKQIETFIKRYKTGNFRLHILKGEADEVIPRVARAEKVDLLVMGTVCRTGIPGFFIGNTAEKVLNEVDCSVLTVKPEGFVSPVTLEV
jgi:nucleotide-binding universal stress UspA family protein